MVNIQKLDVDALVNTGCDRCIVLRAHNDVGNRFPEAHADYCKAIHCNGKYVPLSRILDELEYYASWEERQQAYADAGIPF